MFDNLSMWLPGLGPVSATPVVPASVSRPTAIADATAAYLRPHATWPVTPVSLWDREFTPLVRLQQNVKAVQIAATVKNGEKPNQAQHDALNVFNGWGSLGGLFNPNPSPNWKVGLDDLKAALGSDGITAISQATTTSFFTPPVVAKALWTALEHAGFHGGNILDPASGHGMFLAQMPETIANQSQITALEPDDASFLVLRALYAGYGVRTLHSTFEAADLPEAFFDAVVTNVPFGDFPVPEGRRNLPYRKFLIHDYFIARAVDVVRPGGLIAVITSSGTLDKASEKVRRYLADKVRLIKAIRLPVEAFAAFAGTEPVTDLLVFQRLQSPDQANGALWQSTDKIPSAMPFVAPSLRERMSWLTHRFTINAWYLTHPTDVLGKMELVQRQYQASAVPKCADDTWLSALADRLFELPSDLYQPCTVARPTVVATQTGLRPGSFVVGTNGDVGVTTVVGTVAKASGLSAAVASRVRDLAVVRDAALGLLQAQVKVANDADLLAPRETLNTAYDVFVTSHGAIHTKANLSAFATDPSLPMLKALEVVAEHGKWVKADVFNRRTVNYRAPVEHCNTPEEAMKACLALYGRVNAAWISRVTGTPASVAMATLAQAGLVFLDPATRQWETATAYLSGNVRTKLRKVEAAGRDWAANAGALRKVLPHDLTAGEIHASLGSTWVPFAVYESFAASVLSETVRVHMDAVTGSWSVNRATASLAAHAATVQFGIPDKITAVEIMAKAMNHQQPTITVKDPTDPKKRIVDQNLTLAAREKLHAMNEQFVKWLWSNTERSATLVRIYNDTFNGIVNRAYDGSHMELPGFSNSYTLYPHQRNAVWRVVTSPGATLLAHRVGYGKSLELICSGMELRRIGAAAKIAYVVPNTTLGAFVVEFAKAYPAAHLLVADEQTFAGANRRNFLARAASGDWDGVVLSHSMFERIRVSKDRLVTFIKAELLTLTSAMAAGTTGPTGTVKQMERAKRRLEAKLKDLANAKGDTGDCLTFEAIGFDWLMVDECQYFKNLYRFSKMERIAGLPDSDAQRASDMYIKCRLVMQRHGNERGVTFATGTPVTNSMGELFTMQHFLQPAAMKASGVQSFDSWASNFGEVVNAIEVAPDGSGYRMNRRFAKFVNLPELMALFSEVADIKVEDLPSLHLPDCSRETVASPASQSLKDYVARLVERSEAIHAGAVRPKTDNMLAVTNDGRKAALDMRLVNPSARDDPDSKVNACVRNVCTIWKETAADRLAQVIFSDLGTPTGKTFSVYDDVRRKLIARGIPEAEIAFIHAADTHAAKAKLANDVCLGNIRVVLGSTQKLGVGVNMQDRLIALHHLDAPWRPADIEQREGRIVRQRNRNKEVKIYRYVTQGSFDAYLWQTLETKAKFIAQIMSGDRSIRTAEDLELAALSYAEVKAIASGNPLVLRKAGIDAEVAKLSALRSEFFRTRHAAAIATAMLPAEIQRLRHRAEALTADRTMLASLDARVLTIRGQVVAGGLEIGKAIVETAADSLWLGGGSGVVGMVGDATLSVEYAGKSIVRLVFRGVANRSKLFAGGSRAAFNAFSELVSDERCASLIAEANDAAMNAELRAKDAESDGARSFEHEARYQQLLAEQTEVDRELGIGLDEAA